MKLLALLTLLILTSCTTSADLLAQLKLEEGEIGSICVRGSMDINPNPLANANVIFVYQEHSDGEEPVAC